MAVAPRNAGQYLGRKYLQDGAPIRQEILGYGSYPSEKLGGSDAVSIVSDYGTFVAMPEGLPTSMVDNIVLALGGLKFAVASARQVPEHP